MADQVTYRFFNSENLLLYYVTVLCDLHNEKPKSYKKIKVEQVNELLEVTFLSLIQINNVIIF